MQKIVITGNIGSGKSTIIKIFQKHNVPLFNADSNIQQIYQNDDTFKKQISDINPEFIINNTVSKPKIIAYLEKNPNFIEILETILYPILAIKRQEFIERYQNTKTEKLVFEVPLLFEKNLQSDYNHIILVYAPYQIRLNRALLRQGMTKQKFDFMNTRQIDYTKLLDKVILAIDTTQSIEECERLVIDKFFK